MTLIRRIPSTKDKQYPFLREVDFGRYALRLAALSITEAKPQPIQQPKPLENGDAGNTAVEMPPSRLVGIQARVNELRMILGSSQINNAWIYGGEGIGKSAVVEGMLRGRAEGKLSGRSLSKPFFIFDTNRFFVLPREQWVKEFDDCLAYMAEQRQGVLVIDRMDDFVNTAKGEAERLVNSMIAHLERQEGLQAVIISQEKNVDAIQETSTGLDRLFLKMPLVEEPSFEQLKPMLLAHFRSLEKVHNVTYTEEAADEIIRLLSRYPGRAFAGMRPNNAVIFADKVGAHVRINMYAEPPAVAIMREKIGTMQDELAILADEGDSVKQRRDELKTELKTLAAEYEKDEAEFEQKFKPLHDATRSFNKIENKLAELRNKADRSAAEQAEFDTLDPALEPARKKVEDLEKQLYPAPPLVTVQHVQQVFGAASGIPVSTLGEDKLARLRKLKPYLDREIFLQDKAKQALANAYRAREMGTADPTKPAGVFLFVGGTGLGKTELTTDLVRFDLGIEDNADLAAQTEPVTVNLTEYKDPSSVSKITGAAPGLVGYGDPASWLEEVKKNPRSILLFDEADKAHPDIFDLLMQVLDKGSLTRSDGKKYNFKDTIIVFCMNGLTAEEIGDLNDEELIREKVRQLTALTRDGFGQPLMKPPFINRIDQVIGFESLKDENLVGIMRKEMIKVNRDYKTRGVTAELDDKTAAAIIHKYQAPGSGGRAPQQIVRKFIRPLLTQHIDDRMEENAQKGLPLELKGEHLCIDFENEKITLHDTANEQPKIPMHRLDVIAAASAAHEGGPR